MIELSYEDQVVYSTVYRMNDTFKEVLLYRFGYEGSRLMIVLIPVSFITYGLLYETLDLSMPISIVIGLVLIYIALCFTYSNIYLYPDKIEEIYLFRPYNRKIVHENIEYISVRYSPAKSKSSPYLVVRYNYMSKHKTKYCYFSLEVLEEEIFQVLRKFKAIGISVKDGRYVGAPEWEDD
ncbi:hypothetical protein AAG747_18895 [Rapidithrix thailandica]|uniref:Uncharacterized protein n=1 Tax=Rapidithrix thailandica TaxID=413964 RepID=A0AAW9S478_9BACT